jgi:hypothetical protein
MDWYSAWNRTHTWLDDKGDPIVLQLPDGVVGKLPMWQRGLRPAAIIEADFSICVRHVRGGSLDHVSAYIRA